MPSDFPTGYAEETNGPPVLIASGIFIGLQITIVALRLATRLTHRGQLGIDDYLILPALVFSVGICVIAILEVRIGGVGRHLAVILATDPVAIQNWAKLAYSMETTYCAAIAFPKLSILASYLRIFTTKPFRIAAYCVAAFVSATAIAGIITSLTICSTFAGRWDTKVFPGNCRNILAYWKGMSVPNIVSDVVMLVLPMPVIWRLHIERRQKVALMFVFLLGSLGMVASIVRLIVAFRITGLQDGTYDSAVLVIWSVVEGACYLIAACLPTLRPLFITMAKTARDTLSYPKQSSGALDDSHVDSHHLKPIRERYEADNLSERQMLEDKVGV
ncbi:unnamed protein product [Clonostachys solani]|uniref:Rhodopsin domain-containing protein n=1 Tax=Clonostachys solani TaxID=160281 RepID=A0A9P0EMI4_9HYPO|nr:unnamed protein product [Clonostachys solani]